jgi:WD40 repeat protein
LFGKPCGSIVPSGGRATTAIQFSADGKKLAIGAVHAASVYNALTLQEAVPLPGHADDVAFVHFSPDGKQLLTGTLRIRNSTYDAWTWDTTTWKALPRPMQGVTGLPLISGTRSFDQSICAGMDTEKKLGFYDLASGMKLATLEVPQNQDPFAHAWFSPDSKFYVMVGKDEMGKDVQRLFRVPSGKLVCVLPALGQPAESLRPLAFSGDGRLVACFSGTDGRIHIFDIESGQLRRQLYEPPALSKGAKGFTFRSNLAFSADGKALASWTAADNIVRVWYIATGKEGMILANQESKFGVLMLALSPDGRMVAAGERQIQLREVASGGLRKAFPSSDALLRTLEFSPDGRWLASGSEDSTVLVWDTLAP